MWWRKDAGQAAIATATGLYLLRPHDNNDDGPQESEESEWDVVWAWDDLPGVTHCTWFDQDNLDARDESVLLITRSPVKSHRPEGEEEDRDEKLSPRLEYLIVGHDRPLPVPQSTPLEDSAGDADAQGDLIGVLGTWQGKAVLLFKTSDASSPTVH